MRKDELQHISDSILVEKFAKKDLLIIKQAGLFDSFNLDSVGSFIKSFVKRNVDADAPGGVAGGVINLIVTGALFRLNPLLGALATGANLLGFDITSVAMKIAEKIKQILDSRGSISIGEVNNIGKEVVGSEAGGMPADDMLYALREAEVKIGLQKQGFNFSGKRNSNMSMGKLFEELYTSNRRGRLKWLIGGLVVWTIKMALLGAGLIAGGSLLYKMFGGEPKSTGRLQENEPRPSLESNKKDEDSKVFLAPESMPEQTQESKPLNVLIPSGAGTKVFKNDKNNIWYVPALHGDAFDTLKAWVSEIYPNLSLTEDILLKTPSFMNMVKRLGSPFQGYFAVPESFNSRKQVVDSFITDLARGSK